MTPTLCRIYLNSSGELLGTVSLGNFSEAVIVPPALEAVMISLGAPCGDGFTAGQVFAFGLGSFPVLRIERADPVA